MQTGYFIVGSTGAGKTTYARKLAGEQGVQVFSIDEWMKTLFWMDAPAGGDLKWALERVGRCEEQIWRVAKKLLDSGHDVIFDLGFSKKLQRDQWRSRIITSNHRYQFHFLDIPARERKKGWSTEIAKNLIPLSLKSMTLPFNGWNHILKDRLKRNWRTRWSSVYRASRQRVTPNKRLSGTYFRYRRGLGVWSYFRSQPLALFCSPSRLNKVKRRHANIRFYSF